MPTASHTTSDLSHVGMTQCFLCNQGADILLHKYLRPTLPRNCGVVTTEPCGACSSKIKEGYVGLLLTTEAAITQVNASLVKFKNRCNHDPEFRRKGNFIPDFNPRSFGIFMKKDVLFSTMDASEQMRRVRQMAERDGWVVMVGEAFANMGGLPMLSDEWVAALQEHGIIPEQPVA